MTRKKKRSSAPAPKDALYSIHSAQNLARNDQFDAAIQECELALSIENPIECESALSIENPIDTIKDGDIKRVKTELRELIATAKMNKFKKLVENKSIAQMAKDIEDFQERKKERQAIFDWMRQGFEKVKTPSPANFDTITRAKAYWNNVMSLKAKKELLCVRIKDLKVYVDENNSEIEIGDWRLVDVTAAAKLVEDWSRNESGDQDESQDLKLKPWPHCNDINRDNLIKRIQSILEVLIKTECFAPSHLYMLHGLTLEMLKNRIPEMLLNHC